MNIPWYLSRSAGLAAYLLLFLTVCLGLSIRTRGLDRVLARWKVADIHIFLSLLTIGFVMIHAIVLLWDGFVGYSLKDILVPFSTSYRTAWTAVGILMFYLLAVVLISFPARRFIGYRSWRALHYLTFLAYAGALAHGMFIGTDSQLAWSQLIYMATTAVVVVLIVYRITLWAQREHASLDRALSAAHGPQRRFVAQTVALRHQAVESRTLQFSAGAIALVVVLFLAAGLGPFKWLGTPGQAEGDTTGQAGDNAVAAAAPPNNASSSNAPSSNANAAPTNGFTEPFQGTVSEQGTRAQTDVRMTLSATGQQNVQVNVALSLQGGREGQAQATANTMTMTDAAGHTMCSGEVRQLNFDGMVASCQGSTGAYAGQQLTLVAQFDNGLADQVTGTLQAIVGQ